MLPTNPFVHHNNLGNFHPNMKMNSVSGIPFVVHPSEIHLSRTEEVCCLVWMKTMSLSNHPPMYSHACFNTYFFPFQFPNSFSPSHLFSYQAAWKRQARKVVCVPAPVGGSSSRSSSRPNGELIPSDLWAWRKYGQKPIKGSPYPRCSSSKGCSARKQVERSRTDPNMLVITYTSEHNHPWPTQRNALAGSSRSQHSKHNSSSKPSPATPQTPTTIIQEDQTKNEATRSSPSSSNNKVKEEVVEEIEKQLETEEHHELSEGFQYRVPAMPSNTTNNNQSDDFFADLEELDTHSLTLFFTRPHKSEQCKGGGGLDDVLAFNPPFDWPPPQNNNNNNSQIP
ncbi:probable WRKY transcription factor 14 isoform X2 [Cucurbita moschata]|uniref:Probable WRKY transcription factor 14 isoform X2 n=1 Tax=Cucurbita moschata TaxID=3662 RepID=A0A6J1ECX7_CUCMO|nr:probable WRKY transcription factor 14 isoform X2 [Cucurbita moschata]